MNYTITTIKKQHEKYRKNINWCSKPKQLRANKAKETYILHTNLDGFGAPLVGGKDQRVAGIVLCVVCSDHHLDLGGDDQNCYDQSIFNHTDLRENNQNFYYYSIFISLTH